MIRELAVPDELDRTLALWNEVNPDDRLAVEDIRSWLTSHEEVAVLLAEDGGRDVGYGWIGKRERPLPTVHIVVLEEQRRRGVGSALFATLAAWARARGYADVEAPVREVHPEGLAFARALGFVEIGRDFGLELALRDYEVPAIDPPQGVEIATWAERPDLIRGIYEVAAEASPDIPGEDVAEMPTFEVWLEHDMGGAGDKPEATFVAFAGSEVVGYSKFSLTSAQPTVAHHDLTGVKRAWRGRGIAAALKARQIRWAQENGYEKLVTRNEERNTPIRRLNERFGYQPTPGLVTMRGPV